MRLISSEDFHGSPGYVRGLLDTGQLVAALAYWDSLPKANGLPRREDFDPMHIPRLLPEVFLVDVLPGDRFRFRLAGTRIEQLYRRSLTGLTPEQVLEAGSERVLHAYRLVRDTGQVFYRRGIIHPAGSQGEPIRYQVVLMPFSPDGTTVSQLFGAHAHGDDDA
jgi:hypothetical protein